MNETYSKNLLGSNFAVSIVFLYHSNEIMEMLSILQREILKLQGARFVYKRFRYLLFIILVVLHSQVKAGDIPGAPAVMPPEVLGDFAFLFTNSFIYLDNEYETDEYRTQQLGFQFNILPRWGVVFDYSVMTAVLPNLGFPDQVGRIDQVSLSLMYELYRTQSNPDYLGIIEVGTGFRSYGDFDGGHMQNGFHHLIKLDVYDYPYVDTETNTGIFLLKGDYQKLHSLILSGDNKASWRAGYWLGTTGLISTDSQWDVSLSANAVARNQGMTLWMGLREDWRKNYELDFVQQDTALSESGTSLVFGIGGGPVLFETVQGLGDKLSYSRFVFTSVENEYASAGYPVQASNAVALNLLMPDIEAELQYRRALPYRHNSIGQPNTWLVLDIHYGNPTYDQSFDVYQPNIYPWPVFYVYSVTQQVAIGIEFEWHSRQHSQWVWPYLTLLAGQRTEQIKADQGTLAGQTSEKVSSAAFEVGTGIRISLYSQQKWQFLFQTGVMANYPVSKETVTIDQNDFDLLQPSLAVNMGFSVNFGY